MPTCPNCRAILMGPTCGCGWRRRPEITRVEEQLHVGGGSFFRVTAERGWGPERRVTISTADLGLSPRPNTVISLSVGGQVENFTISNDEAIALMAYLSEVTG